MLMPWTASSSKTIPSKVSLILLVPTVTVLAWCFIASTGLAIALIASPMLSKKVLSILEGVPFLEKSISKSDTGSLPERYFKTRVMLVALSIPRADGKSFALRRFENSA